MRLHRAAALLAGPLMIAALPAPVSATPVTFDFAGNITSADGLTASNYGSRFSGVLAFDTSAIGAPVLNGFQYPATSLAVMFAGGYAATITDPFIRTQRTSSSSEFSFQGNASGRPDPGGDTPLGLAVILSGAANYLTSTALPTTPPSLTNGREFYFAFSVPGPHPHGGFVAYVLGDVTSLTLASTTVPEPASLALLGVGLAGLGLARRTGARGIRRGADPR